MEAYFWKKARAPRRLWRESGRPVWRKFRRFIALATDPSGGLHNILRGAMASGRSGVARVLLMSLERQDDPNIILAGGEFLSMMGEEAAARDVFRRLIISVIGPAA